MQLGFLKKRVGKNEILLHISLLKYYFRVSNPARFSKQEKVCSYLHLSTNINFEKYLKRDFVKKFRYINQMLSDYLDESSCQTHVSRNLLRNLANDHGAGLLAGADSSATTSNFSSAFISVRFPPEPTDPDRMTERKYVNINIFLLQNSEAATILLFAKSTKKNNRQLA